jgi:hypothetical protein
MSPKVKAHLQRHGRKWTFAGIVAVAGTIGTVLVTFGKTLNQLEAEVNPVGPEIAMASQAYVDSSIDARCPAPKRHRKQAAPTPAPRPAQQREGMARRLFHLVW